MEPRIEILEPMLLIGMHQEMSLARNSVSALWRQFKLRRHEVPNRATSGSVSMQYFTDPHADPLDPNARFEKWAAVEVTSREEVPEGMEPYTLRGGKYAVFIHRGPAVAAPKTWGYIYNTWLPNSGYEVDTRENFELLPPDYDPRDPEAQEEVWIPIK